MGREGSSHNAALPHVMLIVCVDAWCVYLFHCSGLCLSVSFWPVNCVCIILTRAATVYFLFLDIIFIQLGSFWVLTKAHRSDPLVTLTQWTHCSQVVNGSLLWLGQFWWHAFLLFSWHCAGFDAEFPEMQSASVQLGPGESSLEPTSGRSTASGWLFVCCCWWRCRHFWVWTDMPLLKQTEPMIKFVTCASL